MPIRTVYVRAKSKKALNALILQGVRIAAVDHSIFNGGVFDLKILPAGTVVKIWEKTVGGQEYAKAYGNVAINKGGAVWIK